jgi:DNA polymerase I-like protein with 3'-5' exonuclease and polymerase domains
MKLAIDTETTGHMLRHDCAAFYVSMADEEGNLFGIEFDVDPYTRQVKYTKKKLKLIRDLLNSYSHHIYHNFKFDIRALSKMGVLDLDRRRDYYKKVHDTHLASHILASNEPHGLKDLGVMYLDYSPEDQTELKNAIITCRRYSRPLQYLIAREDLKEIGYIKEPKDGWWVCDMWLPKAYAKANNLNEEHEFHTVLDRYAKSDAERTMALWLLFEHAMKEDDVWDIYRLRVEATNATYWMEERGVQAIKKNLFSKKKDLYLKARKAEETAIRYSGDSEHNVRSHVQVKKVLFDKWKLEPVEYTGKGHPSTNAKSLEILLGEVKPKGRKYKYIQSLLEYSLYNTATSYLTSYTKQSIDTDRGLVLYPGFNVAGTDTTRASSNNPNAQNISKGKKTRLRDCFGPAEGRVWYSIDYANIELRIFAYASGDKDLIEAFEHGESVHLKFAKVLYSEEWAKAEEEGTPFNVAYKDTYYQWCKNGNFALIYGASKRKADSTYRVKGAYDTIRYRMPLIDKFLASKAKEARDVGYVVTRGGYPLRVPKKLSYKAVNYYIQGSAGLAMNVALIKIEEYLRKLHDHHVCLQIHDELVFDFPDDGEADDHALKCKELMESAGDVIDIPLLAEADIITSNFGEGKAITFQTL